MKLLLDTHAFLWFLAGDRRLSGTARRRIEDSRHERFLSIASVWEMAIKSSLGKLELGDPLAEVVDQGTRENGILLLRVSKEHALGVADLPWHHRDPFDRLLAAQALLDGMSIVGQDHAFEAYGVARVW
ncbi:MAG: type II toxin-antitoxin system VapC family toxin [Deltaproteobacteria bacterium]|nr:type II toxin-antitoxin system VapC family toxin [Deltaproteobacteria bacterium]